MTAIYSQRLAESYNGAGISYTVPAGATAVIRSVTVINRSATVGQQIQIRLGANQLILFLFNVPPMGAGAAANGIVQEGHVVLHQGDQLVGGASPGIDLTISGYLFLT
jgi:hypothetical protein